MRIIIDLDDSQPRISTVQNSISPAGRTVRDGGTSRRAGGGVLAAPRKARDGGSAPNRLRKAQNPERTQ